MAGTNKVTPIPCTQVLLGTKLHHAQVIDISFFILLEKKIIVEITLLVEKKLFHCRIIQKLNILQ